MLYTNVQSFSAWYAMGISTKTSPSNPSQTADSVYLWGANTPRSIVGANSLPRKMVTNVTRSAWKSVHVGGQRVLALTQSGVAFRSISFGQSAALPADDPTQLVLSPIYGGTNPPVFAALLALSSNFLGITTDGDLHCLGEVRHPTVAPLLRYSTPSVFTNASQWFTAPSPIVEFKGAQSVNTISTPSNVEYWSAYIRLADGRLYGLGSGLAGELGQVVPGNFTFVPVQMTAPPGVSSTNSIVQLSPGSTFLLVLLQNGSVYGIGSNHVGQLGIATVNTPYLSPTFSWVQTDISPIVTRGGKIIKLATGTSTTAALTDNGDVFAWGASLLVSGIGGSRYVRRLNTFNGVMATRRIVDIGMSQTTPSPQIDALVFFSEVVVFNSTIDVGIRNSAEIRITGFSFGTEFSASFFQIDLLPLAMVNGTAPIPCLPTRLDFADASAYGTELLYSQMRTLTCTADFVSYYNGTGTSPIFGVLQGQLTVKGEKSNLFTVGNFVDVPSISNSSLVVPRTLRVLNVTGAAFGSERKGLTLTLSSGACEIIESSLIDTYFQCFLSGNIATGPLRMTIARGGASSDASTVAEIVEEPQITRSLSEIPANAASLQIRGSSFGSDATVLQVIIEPGDLTCLIRDVNDSYISCSPVGALSIGAITVTITRNGGASDSGTQIATVVEAPQVFFEEDTPSKVAQNAATVSIRGFNLGRTSEMSVLLSVNTSTASAKRAVQSFSCLPISVSSATSAGLQTMLCALQLSGNQLLPIGNISAQIIRLGAPGPLSPFGLTVPPPSLTSGASMKRARNAQTLVLSGSGFSPSPDAELNTVVLSTAVCNIQTATETEIFCSLQGSPLNGSVITATITVFGGSTSSQTAATLVSPPLISLTSAALGPASQAVVITGTDFDGAQTTVSLSLNTRTIDCTPTEASTATAIICSFTDNPLNETGTLFASVMANGGASNKEQIGVVSLTAPPTDATTIVNGGLPTSTIAGIAAGIVGFALLVALIVVLLVRRRLRLVHDIKLKEGACCITL